MKNSFIFCMLLLLSFAVKAQTFSFTASQIDSITTGSINDDDRKIMTGYVKNNSNTSIQLYCQLVSNEYNSPCNWHLIAICNNVLCWTEPSPKRMAPIVVNDSGIIQLFVLAPVNAPDGIGDFYIRVFDSAQTQVDTMFFRLHKGLAGPDCDSTTGGAITSVSPISKNDDLLKLYPNPAYNKITIALNEKVTAATICITDIAGRVQLRRRVMLNNKTASLDIVPLPPGMYFVKVINDKGTVIGGVRKFLKQ